MTGIPTISTSNQFDPILSFPDDAAIQRERHRAWLKKKETVVPPESPSTFCTETCISMKCPGCKWCS